MKKYKIFSLIFALHIFLLLLLPAQAHALDRPDILAKAAILMNAETGEIYYSLQEDTPLPPASTTKVMTALLALEAVDRGDIALTDMVTASDSSQSDLAADGSTQNIVPGETMSLEDLLYCALVCSANEACNIIGEHVSGGSLSAFVGMMNERARELGCTHTHFANAHGLPAEGHYTSAHDLALISAAAIRHPLFVEIVNTVSREIPATNVSEARYILTSNNLINPDRPKYYYSEASGIKTGSTNEAGYCLISSTAIEEVTVISVVLGCEAVEQEDGSYEIRSFTQTRELLQWFLKNYTKRTVVNTTDLICEVPVELGEGVDGVVVRPQYSVSMLLPKELDLDTIAKRTAIFSQQEGAAPLVAPISAGDVLGELRFTYAGEEYGPIPLVANTSVALSRLSYIKQEVQATISQPWVKWTFFGFVGILVLYFAFVIRYNIIRLKRRKAAHEAAKRAAARSGSGEFGKGRK